MKRREFLKIVGFGVAGLALPLGGCGNSNAPGATDLKNLLSLRKDMVENITNRQFDAAETSYEQLRWLANSAGTLHGHTLGTFAGCYLGHWLYLFGHESRGDDAFQAAHEHAGITPANTMDGREQHLKARVMNMAQTVKHSGLWGDAGRSGTIMLELETLLATHTLGDATVDVIDAAYPDFGLGLYAAGLTDDALDVIARITDGSIAHRIALTDIAAWIAGLGGRERAISFAESQTTAPTELFFILTDHNAARPGIARTFLNLGRIQDALWTIDVAEPLLDQFDELDTSAVCLKAWAYDKLAALYSLSGDETGSAAAGEIADELWRTCQAA